MTETYAVIRPKYKGGDPIVLRYTAVCVSEDTLKCEDIKIVENFVSEEAANQAAKKWNAQAARERAKHHENS